MVTTESLLEAYYDCRRSKRRTASAIEYEMNYESSLISLRDRINSRTYHPGRSICFVVRKPRYREVFAASFEDRIIHHFIALRLTPLFEDIFSPRTFNCRKGKGQLYGVEMLKEDIRRCSNDYTTDCYILKLDLKGFFMSIDKRMLNEKIRRFVDEKYQGEDKGDLLYLCQQVIMHEPQKDCQKQSPSSYWKQLDKHKSLFTNGEGKGLAIGNLFSQIFANYLLNPLDWFLEGEGVKYHGRYVDDFYCVHPDKQKLLCLIPKIRTLLDGLGLRLNERKTYIQHYSKGVEFTGAVVKPGRTYVCNRNIANATAAVIRLNKARNGREAVDDVNSINSYLGIMRHHNEYANRRRLLNRISHDVYKEYIYIKGHYERLSMKRKYILRNETLRRIRRNEYWE